jgi:pyruvate kinase
MERGFVKDGDLVVITGSTQYSSGATNTLQVHIVGNILLQGTSSGNGTDGVSGRVYVIKEEEKDLNGFVPGDILAVSRTTTDILRIMRQCSGVITEEDEGDSGAVPAGQALDIPVISGANGATSILKTGSKIKIDVKNGYVYNSDTAEI